MTFMTNKNRTPFLLTNALALLICMFITLTMTSQTKTDEIAGILSFENETIDYGTIQQHADGERSFKFKNTGEAPIVISTIKTSCGCTVASYNKMPILPGETSDITITYATNRIGAFTKTITIMSNASETKKILKIKGNVLKTDS